ncbi:MAG: aminoacetone oxidase family FAD-binding enzyme [Mogibacterium sp.]|nr:aminoacetone oxidase family FAD-binding enzyme [Mogibacterium sp.]
MIYCDCIIIGAGASGLLAASLMEAPASFRGLILEATGRPGTKLLLTGGGHCNYTHAGSVKDFVSRYGDSGRKIRTLLYRYNNQAFRDFLEAHGIPSVTQEDGRVFPASMRASDIRDLLLDLASGNGFQIRTDARVTRLQPSDGGRGYSLRTADGEAFTAPRVIVATGGCSYPGTGSDGGMFDVLRRDLGLAVTPLLPGLLPVEVAEYPYAELAGITLPDCEVAREIAGAKTVRQIGPVLLTHRGFSGPPILNLSRSVREEAILKINYLYPKRREEVLEELQRTLNRPGTAPLTALAGLYPLPKRFLQELLRQSGATVSAKRLASLLTEDRFTVRPGTDWQQAMVTCGGVSLEEVDLRTLECLRYPGLFIIGEALDVDGDTGGYNLQFAFSSSAACVNKS